MGYRADVAEWDTEIKADFPERGPGAALIGEWDAEIARRESISLDEFFRSHPESGNRFR